MSKFLEVVEGKRTKNLVENLRVARTGRITYLLDGKQASTVARPETCFPLKYKLS